MSQEDIAKKVGVHGAVIGRYERDEAKPSIEMAAQIANALEVSLDYLVGNADLILDHSILERIRDIQKLNDQDKADAFKFLDMFLRMLRLEMIINNKTQADGLGLYFSFNDKLNHSIS